MGPVKEELNVLCEELKSSKRDKEQSIDLLGDLISNIVDNNVPSVQRAGVCFTVGAYIGKVRAGIPKVES